MQSSISRFNQAVSSLSPTLKEILLGIPSAVKQNTFEVRIRAAKPLMLTSAERSWFVDENSQMLNLPKFPYICTAFDISESILSMCEYSVHTHSDELRNGFITLRGGHRAGICGKAVMTDGKISAVRDVTSINLRIAREISGAASEVMDIAFEAAVCGLLIIGVPSSGKTTILRDLARQLASGIDGKFIKVAVVDERDEIGAVVDGLPQNNLGYSCDILSGYTKADGIMTALRTLSPEVIICDEIGTGEEVSGVLECINSGVKLIATAHGGSFREIMRRPQIMRLLESGAFEKVVRLGNAKMPGKVLQIVEVGDLIGKDSRNVAYRAVYLDDRKNESENLVAESAGH